jgi:MoxR-like ATPase
MGGQQEPLRVGEVMRETLRAYEDRRGVTLAPEVQELLVAIALRDAQTLTAEYEQGKFTLEAMRNSIVHLLDEADRIARGRVYDSLRREGQWRIDADALERAMAKSPRQWPWGC